MGAPSREFRPIGDYALVGDCHGAALVSLDGDVDWCCLGRFDAKPALFAILDRTKGGVLSTRPRGPYVAHRGYANDTGILETTLVAAHGTVVLRDVMPVGRTPAASIHDYVTLVAPGILLREIEGIVGEVEIDLAFASGTLGAGAWLHHCGTDGSFRALRETIRVKAGERKRLVLAPTAEACRIDTETAADLLARTTAFWKEWISYCRYDGQYAPIVRRSAIVLKQLTYAPTGALVAAPTTSLPEEIGGSRNWDYRYCWLRDTAFALYALGALGYSGEASEFSSFLHTALSADPKNPKILYDLDGRAIDGETEHPALEGYRGSRPVRFGNGAADQRQLDVHGEVLDWALIHHTLGGRIGNEMRENLCAIGDAVMRTWQEPDQGIWEMRGPPRQHTFGKVMAWVAMDRLVRLFGARKDWTRVRDEVRDCVLHEAIDPKEGWLRGTFERGSGPDAALLLAPVVGFPAPRRVLEKTLDEIERRLGHGPFTMRYEMDDGVPGDEGAFLACSFWRVDARLILGRPDEARQLFEQLVDLANDVGLYAEEMEPREGGLFLGNFPQALTHLALVQSAAHLALHDAKGAAALEGDNADRARRGVGATAGWRAILAAVRQSGRLGRLRSSGESVLPDEESMTSN